MQISIGEQEVIVDGKVYTATTAALPPGQLSANFTVEEFTCNHCGKIPSGKPPQALVDILQQVRDHFGAATVVNSGYRCPTHNANVGGAPNSQHLVGDAADIAVSGVHAHKVYDYVATLLAGTGGLGKYDTFTHIDVRAGAPARW